LKLNYNVEIYAGIVFVVFYFPLVVINLLGDKVSEKKDVEKTINKVLKIYGKSLVLIVSIQFFIVVLLLLIAI